MRQSLLLSSLARLFTFVFLIATVVGWGHHGHYITCKIAEEHLWDNALVSVKKLLPESAENDLANVCSWADEIRFHYHWSAPLHFVDTPDFKCNYDYYRDCHDSHGNKDRCVTGAIYNYTMQLSAAYNDLASSSTYNLTEAVMFLAHFVGDAHQPLHVGFDGDEGGNAIRVRWYNRRTNLHHVWDDLIIESALKTRYHLDPAYMIRAIQKNITEAWSNEVHIWESCKSNRTVCPDVYASESISLACKFAYKNASPGSVLEDEYFLSRLPIVEKRLAQGGVRLASILNHVFASHSRIAQL